MNYYILFPNKEACTNLITIKKRRPLNTPSQVCDNLTIRMMKSTHYGVYFNGLCLLLLKFQFEVAVREGIKAIKMSCRKCFHTNDVAKIVTFCELTKRNTKKVHNGVGSLVHL